MCYRLDHLEKRVEFINEKECQLEKKLAYMEGKEAANAVIVHQSQQISELKAIIGDLKNDLKLCHKVDGEVLMKTDHLANTYIAESRVLSSHPPVVIDRPCGGGGNGTA